MSHTDTSKKAIVFDMLSAMGDNPRRPGLLETPDRVVRAWGELFSGYGKNPKDVFKIFDPENESGPGQIVILRNIEFYSMCEHHAVPFVGTAHIAYIPNDKVIGVSKLARLLEIFARRLQIQERIGQQVTDALTKYLKPKGAACILVAKHLCVSSRGVEKQQSEMVTSSMTGCFLEEASAKAELMSLIKI